MKNFVIFSLLLLVASTVRAQSIGGAVISDKTRPIDTSSREQLSNGVDTEDATTISGVLPFGANLFNGGFSNDREDGINPDYAINAGDLISVRIFGAKNFNDNLVVDHQGNIFIPEIGPIPVQGVANRDLNRRVSDAVGEKYKDNVQVYTSLNGSQPVAVFVTGFVANPGRFSGIPSNSVLHFIDRAGGIDQERGSYREILIQRQGQTLVTFDLYDFLLKGSIPDVQFMDGDTILIKPRGGVVEAAGAIRNPARFEVIGQQMTGADLMRAALLQSDVTHVGVSGTRNREPISHYMPLAEFNSFRLLDGDQVSFRSDAKDKVIVVEVEGVFAGPSRYTVPPTTRLIDLLDHIEVDPELSDPRAISLRRQSIAGRQRAALQESLQRLESRFLTTTALTLDETSIRTTDAELIGQFVERAREIEPNGRLVVANNGKLANVLLQQGDVITIPSKSDSVLLSGEVLVSQALLHQKASRARDYINQSGGFAQQADTSRIIVVHANGEVTTGHNPKVLPGDEIIVLPRVPVKNLQLAATIVDVLYKVAIGASVALRF